MAVANDTSMSAGVEKKRHSARSTLLCIASLVGLLAVLLSSTLEYAFVNGIGVASRRQPVSGRVLYAGQPVARGTIDFIAQMVPHGDSEFVNASAEIRDGCYEVPKREGLVPGWYLVRVFSHAGADGSPSDEPAIPPKYNTESAILVSVLETGPLRLSFRLP